MPAVGRTLAELRQAITEDAAQWYKHLVVTVAVTKVHGHHYLLLGKMVDKGRYPLDRSWRLLDVLARARGIEAGLLDGNTVEISRL